MAAMSEFSSMALPSEMKMAASYAGSASKLRRAIQTLNVRSYSPANRFSSGRAVAVQPPMRPGVADRKSVV